MGVDQEDRTCTVSSRRSINAKEPTNAGTVGVRFPTHPPNFCFSARVLEFRHTGWSQKPVSHGRESSNLSTRTNVFAPLPQLVVGLVSNTRCCGFESHEANQYFVSFLCVAQSGRVLGLDPRGRRFKSCRTDHVL